MRNFLREIELFHVMLLLLLLCSTTKVYSNITAPPFQQWDYITICQVNKNVAHYCSYHYTTSSTGSLTGAIVRDRLESEIDDESIWVVDTLFTSGNATNMFLLTTVKNVYNNPYYYAGLSYDNNGIGNNAVITSRNRNPVWALCYFEQTTQQGNTYNTIGYCDNKDYASVQKWFIVSVTSKGDATWIAAGATNYQTIIRVYDRFNDSIISNATNALDYAYQGGSQTIGYSGTDIIYSIADRWVEKNNGGHVVKGKPTKVDTLTAAELSNIQSVTLASNSNNRFTVTAHTPTASDTTFATITVGENYTAFADTAVIELNVRINNKIYKVVTTAVQAANPYAQKLKFGQAALTYPNDIVGVRVQHPVSANIVVPIKLNTDVTITAANIVDSSLLQPLTIVNQSLANGLELTIPNNVTLQQGESYKVIVDFDYSDTAVHHAQTHFMLTLVPQIVMWKGAMNADWNNDANWIGVDNNGQEQYRGFVPLSTTDVIISQSKNYPSLASAATPSVSIDINFVSNSCHNIHFEANTMLLNQYLLQYNNAWVDMKVPTKKWYLFGMPLVGMFSGDFYIPSAGESVTPYFQAGAVDGRNAYQIWQRLYNKNVVVVNADSTARYRAVEWSKNYNALNKQFNSAEGVAMWVRKQADTSVDSVMFRFPKSATTYYYYNENDVALSQSETITRPADYGKLAYKCTNPLTGEMVVTLRNDTSATGEKSLFLLSNPAMANMSIQKFYNANSQKINPFCRVIDSRLSTAKKVSLVTQKMSVADKVLKPGESLFIYYKGTYQGTNYDTLQVVFTPDMFTLSNNAGTISSVSALSIVANYEGSTSELVVEKSAEASNNYIEGEDDELLLWSTTENSAAIYSVADSVAVVKNCLNDLHNMPICIYSTDSVESTATIQFQGVNEILYLFDSRTNQYTQVQDSTSITIEVNPANPVRYFVRTHQEIVDNIDNINSDDIQLFTPQAERLVITSKCANVAADIFTPNGMLVSTLTTSNGIINTSLPAGVYMLKIKHCDAFTTHKIIIR